LEYTAENPVSAERLYNNFKVDLFYKKIFYIYKNLQSYKKDHGFLG